MNNIVSQTLYMDFYVILYSEVLIIHNISLLIKNNFIIIYKH